MEQIQISFSKPSQPIRKKEKKNIHTDLFWGRHIPPRVQILGSISKEG